MQGAASIAAPAKLNLRLRVLGRRRDGFHELETLMVRLPCLADRIEAEAAGEFSFGCDDPTVPCDERNLVVRAARGFERVAGIRLPWRINLEKRIPHGAGLGGGSSDAAAMLRLLDGLHPGLVDPAKISDLAARLGSDVPFFLGSGPAICRGRGERVKAAAAVPPLPVVLFKPGFGVATPEAYARWQGAEALPGVDFSPQALAWGTLCNDLERPVFAKHLFLAEIRCWLRARDEVAAALMSGSGATMFAILREPSAAPGLVAAALEQLDPTLWTWAGWSEGSAAS